MIYRRRKLAIRYTYEMLNMWFGGSLYRDMEIWLPRERNIRKK